MPSCQRAALRVSRGALGRGRWMRAGLGWQPGSALLKPSPQVTPVEISAPCCQEGPCFAPTAGQRALLHQHDPVGAQGCGSPWWPCAGDCPGRAGTVGLPLPGRRCHRQDKFLQSYLGGTKYESPPSLPKRMENCTICVLQNNPTNPR